MALAFGIAAVAPDFVPLFFGAGYNSLVPLMRLLSCILPLICATNVIGVQWLLPVHRDRDFTLSVLCGAAIDMLLNAVLIPRFGASGAAFSTVVAEVTVLTWQTAAVWRDLPLVECFVSTLPFAAIGTIMYCIIRITKELFPVSWTRLVAEVTLGGFVYLLLLTIWSVLKDNERLNRIFPNISH